jgi:DNA ligase 1
MRERVLIIFKEGALFSNMEFIWPMLLMKSDPFSSTNHIYEWKFDGIRLQLSSIAGEIRAHTRHKTDCTKRFPELHSFHSTKDVILDGELICINPETQKDDWELVMERFRLTNEFKIQLAVRENPVIMIVFDILYLENETLFHLPLLKRKRILEENLVPTNHVQPISYIDTEGEVFFEKIVELQLEGCVAKRKSGLYHPAKRTDDFLKIVRYEYYEVLITGMRKGKFGLLCSFQPTKV